MVARLLATLVWLVISVLVLSSGSALAADPIRVAVLGPMGFLQGEHHWRGAQIARDEINDAGGVDLGGERRPIELIQIETNEMLSVSDATTAAERAITRNRADFLVGGFRSEAVLAMQDVAMDYQKIFLGVGAAHGELGERVQEDYDTYKYWFRVSPTKSADLGRQLFAVLASVAEQIRTELGRDDVKVALLAERAVWADPLVQAAEHNLPNMGMEVVGTWRPSAVATDVTAELSAINRAGADIIFTMLSGPVGIVVGRQSGEMELAAVPFGINVEAQKAGFWQATDGKANYLATLDTYSPVEVTEYTIPFVESFIERFGEPPAYTAATYDAIRVLAQSIEATGTLDADTLVDYMEETTFRGTAGNLKFDERHDPTWGPGFVTGLAVQWQDGEKVAFWPNGWQGVSYEGMRPFRFPTAMRED
ncbi:MAG: ABC transporter substrate-binding protein [Ectothiorhodospiraceae bacterium]|nr:ABC transporter substrate-binding protein [Ectothiorhodospiraceae bacterium]